jgi:predicted acetyltransferase
MSGVEIRHVQPEEKLGWLRTMRTTFLMDPAVPVTDALMAWWDAVWDSERIWGAFASERCVATLRTFPTTLTVPAGDGPPREVAVDALTQVTVAATHRRQGVLSRMLTGSLGDAHARGEVLSVLRAAEWPIYGRFGYQASTRVTDYRVIMVPREHVAAPQRPLRVQQLDPAELRHPAADVLARARLGRAGQLARPGFMWDRLLGLNGVPGNFGREPVCIVTVEPDGTPAGYAVWTAGPSGSILDRVAVTVHELIAVDLDAYRSLWSYLLGLDLVSEIRWPEQSVDEPLEWLVSDGRAVRRELTYDSLWVRILDVVAALSARRYAVQDVLVLDVVDAEGGWAAGRYLLDAGPDHAECRRVTAGADLQLSQRALAAVYLGEITLREQCAAGLVNELTPGAVNRFQAMLATVGRPWNATPF